MFSSKIRRYVCLFFSTLPENGFPSEIDGDQNATYARSQTTIVHWKK